MVVKDEPAEALCAAGPAQNHSRARFAEAIQRVAAVDAVVFDFGSHDHRVFGLSSADHLDTDMAGVEESDRAIEHVEGESLWSVRGFDVVVDPELAGDKCRDGRFGYEVVPVHPGVKDQIERSRVDSAVIQARRRGLRREADRMPRRGLDGWGRADSFDPHAGRRWLHSWLPTRREAVAALAVG